ncbi:MAG: hypothetical protein HY039_09040 [Nitrospirae bacterium]|nr:hypothetical protein [Nitrospirota bacterium]
MKARHIHLPAAFFAAYFLLAAGIAVHHAYAQNELVHDHGCSVGHWLKHAPGDSACAPEGAPVLLAPEAGRVWSSSACPSAPALAVSNRGPPSSHLQQ